MREYICFSVDMFGESGSYLVKNATCLSESSNYSSFLEQHGLKPCYFYMRGYTCLLILQKRKNSQFSSTFGLFVEQCSVTRGYSLLPDTSCFLLMLPYWWTQSWLNANNITFALLLFIGAEET